MKILLNVIACIGLIPAGYVYAQTDNAKEGAGKMDEEIRIIEKQRPVSLPRSYGGSRTRDWQALDNRSIVLEDVNHKKYKATFMGPCPGIRSTAVIALSNRGPVELDQFTTVILPDGLRCPIKELVPYTAEMEQEDRTRTKTPAN
jgi:hypothetical protein